MKTVPQSSRLVVERGGSVGRVLDWISKGC